MRKVALLSALLLSSAAQAADVHVIVSGEVRPGLYGRVEVGHAPPPPVVYEQPVVIVRQPRYVPVQPIYMHVPPGHAKHWEKHCREYDACGRPVYFVKSEEYEVRKVKKHKKEHRHWD
jgi:hypothetical protein